MRPGLRQRLSRNARPPPQDPGGREGPKKPWSVRRSEHPACPMVVMRQSLRRSSRSTSGPANSPSATSGIACDRPTAPVHAMLPIISQTWNITSTIVIWPPKPDRAWPIQSAPRRRNCQISGVPAHPFVRAPGRSAFSRAAANDERAAAGRQEHGRGAGRTTPAGQITPHVPPQDDGAGQHHQGDEDGAFGHFSRLLQRTALRMTLGAGAIYPPQDGHREIQASGQFLSRTSSASSALDHDTSALRGWVANRPVVSRDTYPWKVPPSSRIASVWSGSDRS